MIKIGSETLKVKALQRRIVICIFMCVSISTVMFLSQTGTKREMTDILMEENIMWVSHTNSSKTMHDQNRQSHPDILMQENLLWGAHTNSSKAIHNQNRQSQPEIDPLTLAAGSKFDQPRCNKSQMVFRGTFDQNLRKLSELQFPEASIWIKKLGLDQPHPFENDIPSLPVLVTSASSDFFDISQGLIKTVHEILMPKYPDLKFIYYGLGMKEELKLRLQRYCRCEYRDFPDLNTLPVHVRNLKNYAFKAIIVSLQRYCRCEYRDFPDLNTLPVHVRNWRNYAFKAIIVAILFHEFGHVWWVDSSVRFITDDLEGPLQYLKQTGSLFFTYDKTLSVAQHTMITTFNYFKEHPCPYYEFGEIEAGNVAFYYNNVSRIIVRNWVSCALIQTCIAPPRSNSACRRGNVLAGQCHRYDQSVLSIILRRLYHEQNDYPMVEKPYRIIKVMRRNRVDYLPLLKKD